MNEERQNIVDDVGDRGGELFDEIVELKIEVERLRGSDVDWKLRERVLREEIERMREAGKFAIAGLESLIAETVKLREERDENVTLRENLDARELLLASVTDCINTFCREHNVVEIENYLTLAVRDGVGRLVYRLLRQSETLRARVAELECKETNGGRTHDRTYER